MSNLNFLEKLLDGVEVVWWPVSDVTKRTNNIKWQEATRSYQYIDLTSVSIDTKTIIETSEVTSSNAPSRAQKLVKKDDVLFATTRPTQMRYCLIDEEYNGAVASTGYCVLRVNQEVVLPKWILHLVSSGEFKKYLEENQSGSAYPAISDAKVKEFKIPIPCPNNPEKSLAIQAEIVRILDAFTAMTAELTAELNMRKKQYNYYRDQLLSFEEGEVEWKTLGDENFFEVGSGGTPSKSKPEYWDDGNIPWLKSESCNNEPVYFANNFITELGLSKSSAKLLQKKTTLIALVGATIFKTAFLEFPAATNQNIASIKSKKPEAVSDKFVFYYITNLYEVLKSEMRNYGMLNLTTLRQFRIPIPHPEEQARIVAILDKFDALTNSITEGLPREIELRQKQYEYYRDLLLSFPKPEEAAA